MRVLIVAKTRMHGAVCVGGLVLDTNRNVRLLTRQGLNQPTNTDYGVGQVWELGFEPRTEVAPPHVEDVLVFRRHRVSDERHLRDFLLARVYTWRGSPDALFDGLLQFTPRGSGYIAWRTGVPRASVGFWLPDHQLQRVQDGNRVRYVYSGERGPRSLTYVGCMAPGDIPPGALLRVSLARWWRPDNSSEERCYLQLSGWFV